MLKNFYFLCFLTLASSTIANVKIQRKLTKAGFHRDIETTIHLPLEFVKECVNSSLLIFETLPAGVYSDPFQLKSQEGFGGPQVYFAQSVDIEAAEFKSKPLEILVFVTISSFSLHELSKDVMETNVILPIHARYHQAATDPTVTHAIVTVLHPGLYTNCTIDGLSDHHTLNAPCDLPNCKRCTWVHLPYQSKSSQVSMDIPVGQAKHKPLVIIASLFVSVGVSAMLSKIVLSHKHSSLEKIS